MPIGTSDGQYFDDEVSYTKSLMSGGSIIPITSTGSKDKNSGEIKVAGKFVPADSMPPQELEQFIDQWSTIDSLDKDGKVHGMSPEDFTRSLPDGVEGTVIPKFGSGPALIIRKTPARKPEPLVSENDAPITDISSASKQQPMSYQDWIKQNNLTETPDYDLKAAYDAGLQPDERGHLPDTFKKPNHITFSDESVFNEKDGNEGGHWEQDSNGKWTFTPGPTNLKYHSPQELQDYFKKYEPDATLNMPKSSNEQKSVFRNVVDNLFGLNGKKRYKLFPERMVDDLFDSIHKGASLLKDAQEGKVDLNSPDAINQAIKIAPLAISGIGTSLGREALGAAVDEGAISALRSYASTGYRAINRYLAGIPLPEGVNLNVVREQIRHIDNLFDTAAVRAEKPMELYRGIQEYNDVPTNFQPGDVLHWPGFTSTSKRFDVATDFSGEFADKYRHPTVFIIEAPAGTKTLDMNHFSERVREPMGLPDEAEVVLPRGSKFEVQKVLPPVRAEGETDFNNVNVVHLKYLGGSKSKLPEPTNPAPKVPVDMDALAKSLERQPNTSNAVVNGTISNLSRLSPEEAANIFLKLKKLGGSDWKRAIQFSHKYENDASGENFYRYLDIINGYVKSKSLD